MGILRKLPEGFGAEEPSGDADPAARATMELPGTAAASRPPEAARNFRRSKENSLGEACMPVTSTNAAPACSKVSGGIIRRRHAKCALKIIFAVTADDLEIRFTSGV